MEGDLWICLGLRSMLFFAYLRGKEGQAWLSMLLLLCLIAKTIALDKRQI